MGAALYIVLDSNPHALDATVGGKALSRAEAMLDVAAKRLGVTPLMDFFSMSEADAEFAAQELGVSDSLQPASGIREQWFDPEAGLRTVSALLAWLDTEPSEASAEVREDLLQFQRVLQEAKLCGLRWHLAVDY